MNDAYHLSAGILVAIAALAVGVGRGASKRLNREETGYEPTLIVLAAAGPFVAILAAFAAVAVEVGIKAFPQ